MNKAEEDALVEKFASMTYALATRPPKESPTHAIRLAIRAAYAKGREDAARVAEGRKWQPVATSFQEDENDLIDELAAAIRRGE